MKLTTELLHETALYVKEYYDAEFSDDFTFHNYNRTVTIVRNCMTLGVQMNLKKEESKISSSCRLVPGNRLQPGL